MKIIKLINLHTDATNLNLITDFSRHEITTSDSEEENIDAYHRNREIIDAHPSLEFPKFVVNNRKKCFHK